MITAAMGGSWLSEHAKTVLAVFWLVVAVLGALAPVIPDRIRKRKERHKRETQMTLITVAAQAPGIARSPSFSRSA